MYKIYLFLTYINITYKYYETFDKKKFNINLGAQKQKLDVVYIPELLKHCPKFFRIFSLLRGMIKYICWFTTYKKFVIKNHDEDR